jgi:DNA polymerase III alpha subunit
MKTELKNRTLWYDGTNQVEPEDVPQLILDGVPLSKIVVNSLNEDLETFNTLEDVEFPLNKTENCVLGSEWNIPAQYKNIDLKEYILTKLIDRFPNADDRYVRRLEEELHEISNRDVEDLFRTLIFVTETLLKSDTVLGVGRGSSCASLFLFVLGLHKVDPIRYNIPASEFFHD